MTELVIIAPGVHALESSLRVTAGFHLPVRTSLLELTDGGLMMISPLAVDDLLAARVDALGRVRHIVAPNTLHHLFLNDAAARWPAAELHVPRGLPPKLAKRGRALPAHTLLPEGAPSGVRVIPFEGAPGLDEHVFFHAASRTLVVTDLVFHVQAPQGPLTGLILRAVGAHRTVAQSRALRMLIRDPQAARRSVEHMLALDFTRLVMAHGVVLEQDAKAQLRSALRHLLP